MKRSRRVGLIVLAAIVLAAVVFVAVGYCPPQGIALTRDRRDFHRLKNRTALPEQADFDPRVTLESLLQPGDDRMRWSNFRAARVEGYVVAVSRAGTELANCYFPCARDIHINLALRMDAPLTEQLVVETTPRVEVWARSQGRDWSEAALKRDLIGRWCLIEGWLLFDQGHDEESENIAPGRAGNWRATAWEIHPVTGITVMRDR